MEEFFQQLFTGLMLGSTYAVVALGFGLAFSVLRVVQLAHPAFVMAGAYGAFVAIRVLKVDAGELSVLPAVSLFVVVLLAVGAAGGIAGVLMDRLTFRPLRGRATYFLIPMIAAAGVAMILEHGAQRVFGPDPLLIPSLIPMHVLSIWGVRITSMQVIVFLTSMAVMVALRYYVYNTMWGHATRAVAENPEVALGCGINVDRVYQLALGIAAAMAGVAGVSLGLLHTTASPFMGVTFGTKSFVCMLVAGNRHLEGIMVVGLGIGIIEAMVTGYISSNLRDVFAFPLLIAVLVFRPDGLFGSYEA